MAMLIENASQVITCSSEGKRYKAGKTQSRVDVLRNCTIYIEGGLINWLGKKLPAGLKRKDLRTINAENKIVLPGFIDSHTHLVFAGNRIDEYAMRLAGKSYEKIAKAGGGILNTVEAVRESTEAELTKLALERVKRFVSCGVTTCEAKSGYGLNTETEMKMLSVINELNHLTQVDVYPTFLGAHAIPPDLTRRQYIELILHEMIPEVSEQRLAYFIDVFCELNYFTPKEADTILQQGVKFGLIPKLHTNQFYSIGGIETALKNKAISVDHLEVMKTSDVKALSGKGIAACLLPGVSYFLDIPYAPARKLIENNVPVAVATDYNPGSCKIDNIQLIMSLAAHQLKMSIEETINAVTINAAAALGISNRVGSIETGKQADIVIFDTPDYRDIFYEVGVNKVEKVIKKGKVIYPG